VRLFDDAAAEYDAARPSYPDGVYDLLEARAGALKGRAVADGGTGTGVVARQLLERGAHVVAFDPGPAMLRRARLRSPGLPVLQADGAALPFLTESLSLLCFGQSWHWVEQEAGARGAARVLTSKGWWAAWWNHPWADGEAWFERYYSLLEERCAGFSREQRNVDWGADAIERVGSFQEPTRHVVEWQRTVSVEDWLTDLRSHSYVIDLDHEPRTSLLSACEEMLRERFDEVMTVPYQTRVWIAQKSG
jgi:ubiquinone/menaquinone biosynthesis C-methylase UbiE